jgi:hypothetical protein
LRKLAVHDEWCGFHSSFVVKRLLEFGKRHSWKAFKKLECVNIDLPHKTEPVADKVLYERLSMETGTAIVARCRVLPWRAPCVKGPEGWRTGGAVWFSLTVGEVKQRAEAMREERRRLKECRDKERSKMRLEKWLKRRKGSKGSGKVKGGQEMDVD